MAYIDTVELLPCKKCESIGALKSIVNGNVAILCTNKDVKTQQGVKAVSKALTEWRSMIGIDEMHHAHQKKEVGRSEL